MSISTSTLSIIMFLSWVTQNNFPTDLADPISEIEKFFSTAGKVDFVKVFYTTDSNEAIADAADKGEEVKEDATAEESKKDEGAEEAKEGAAEAVKEKKERKFAGAAFVEFADSKDAKKAKEMKWKMGERDIEVVSKWVLAELDFGAESC